VATVALAITLAQLATLLVLLFLLEMPLVAVILLQVAQALLAVRFSARLLRRIRE
jgi:hypothetical protein